MGNWSSKRTGYLRRICRKFCPLPDKARSVWRSERTTRSSITSWVRSTTIPPGFVPAWNASSCGSWAAVAICRSGFALGWTGPSSVARRSFLMRITGREPGFSPANTPPPGRLQSHFWRGFMKKESKGLCILAGAGPGDLGLMTLRARQAVEQAEVVVYDYLCNPEVLKWAPANAEIVYAGKR